MFQTLPDIYLDGRTKGMPADLKLTPLGEIGAKGWNVLAGDVPSPAAVLKVSALRNNQKWMSSVVSHYGVSLCPHGKTTMAPQIFASQLAGGCWGITLSTLHQVRVARHYGVQRIVIANQILDRAFLRYLFDEREGDPNFECFHLIDSNEGIDAILAETEKRTLVRPFEVLIEVGAENGRTGVRTIEEATALATRMLAHPKAMQLRGVEGFEGSLQGVDRGDTDRRVEDLLSLMVRSAEQLDTLELFGEGEILLSAGGSAYFDRVAKRLAQCSLERPKRVVLRSGCYISHDSQMYEALVGDVLSRSPELVKAGHPKPALEIWATVQSRPESDLLFLNIGKRDVSFDIHMPRVTGYIPIGDDEVITLKHDHQIVALNDQHAYLRCPPDGPLRPGDRVSIGISHPCTTFDKWDVLVVTDDDYNVIDAIKTFF